MGQKSTASPRLLPVGRPGACGMRAGRTGAEDTIKCGAPNLKVAFGRVQIFLFVSVPSKINPMDKYNLLFPDNFVNNSELTFTDTILILFTL
ncbi:hypothetical protein METP3_03577 [Methanosarcinales archaeon]|nr:hypothetical protein METP3_03577 [Methanosarcinales archaeon]